MYKILLLTTTLEGSIKEVATHYSAQSGYEVQTVDNGLDAMEAIRASRPDLIVMNLLLRKLDGVRLCQLLKEDPDTASIPVIFISIVPATKYVKEVGAELFLLEPVSASELIKAIDYVAGGSSSGKQGKNLRINSDT